MNTQNNQDYPRGVELVVAPLVLNEQNQVLMSRSPKFPDRLGVHGGHVDPGETIQQTAIRETQEEVGIDDCLYVAALEVCEFIAEPHFYRKAHLVCFPVVLRTKQQPTIDNNEVLSAGWYNLADLLKDEGITSAHQSILQKLAQYLSNS